MDLIEPQSDRRRSARDLSITRSIFRDNALFAAFGLMLQQ
jgi:hypothetical protein